MSGILEDDVNVVPTPQATTPPTIEEPENTPQTPPQQPAPEKKPEPKLFSRNGSVKYIEKHIGLPGILPGMIFGFKFRIALSQDAEERRQVFLGLSAADRTIKLSEQNLDELCDLIIELPTGFSDLKPLGQNPGASLKSYIDTCPDPIDKQILYKVVNGAMDAYWASLTPYEFQPKV